MEDYLQMIYEAKNIKQAGIRNHKSNYTEYILEAKLNLSPLFKRYPDLRGLANGYSVDAWGRQIEK